MKCDITHTFQPKIHFLVYQSMYSDPYPLYSENCVIIERNDKQQTYIVTFDYYMRRH